MQPRLADFVMSIDKYSRKLIDTMNRYYDERAPLHDYYMSYKSIEGMEELLKPIVETVAARITGKDVLEIACGTGNWTQVLARRAHSVIATDVSRNVLDIALGKLAGYHNASLIQCDAYDLSGINGRFDVVFASDWWSHMPKRALPMFFDSVIGKLKSASTAIFVDMSFREYFRQEPCHYDSDDNRVSHRLLPNGSAYEVVKNFPDEAELRRFFSAYAGDVDYYEFPPLQRWMVAFTSR
jgi:2-polyprenyl-3-methyl-5-hydroxy-6-metoxy-1,4-benzoquinol methylase